MTQPATFARLTPNAADLRAAAAALQDDPDPRAGFARAARRLCGADTAALVEPDGDGLVVTAVAGSGPLLGRRLPLARTNTAGLAFLSGERVVAMEARGHPSVDQSAVRRLGLRSIVVEPIVRQNTVVAAVTLGWKDPLAELDDMALGFLALLCAQAAVAIERARLAHELRQQARTDQLTGLPNRRALADELMREMARARRTGSGLGLGVLDLDHFKRVNDARGHQAGDEVLARSAGSWSAHLRDVDVLGRYGGEEFVVVLPDCPTIEHAAVAVERIRRATPAPVTASAGVAFWDGREVPGDLFARADAALYRAKAAGRDRTELA